ncbi:MAG: hypothetical protein ACTS6G_03750 [Candidatus Hodgkinia cicadicola]
MIKRGTEDRGIRKGNRSYGASAVASETSARFGPSAEVNQIPLRAERPFDKLRSEASKPFRTVSRSQNTLTPFVLFCGSFGVCLFGLLSVWIGASKAKHSTLDAVAEQTMRIPFRAGVCHETTAEAAAFTSVKRVSAV